jgi:chemotaxis protein methyltransferase CheR
MGVLSQNLVLPSGTDALLRNLVHERTGVFFDDSKLDLLVDKISPLVIERGFHSYLDYYYLLKYDEAERAEWMNVMNMVSVQETYFWREVDQVKALVQNVLPSLHEMYGPTTLRIWSAACATGEEPLTIAIALNEAGWFEKASIEIVASDASSKAISKARKGVYNNRSVRNLSLELRQKYFTPQAGSSLWQINEEIHNRIDWSLANLVDEDQISSLASAHVIFCRNVFIYFSDTAISRVVRSFAKFMRPPGYLFVGASESLIRLAANYTLAEVNDAFVYLKQETA